MYPAVEITLHLDHVSLLNHWSSCVWVRVSEPLSEPHLDMDTAIDVLWVLNDPAHYASLVLQRGWSEDSFRSWLAATMKHGLLRSQYI